MAQSNPTICAACAEVAILPGHVEPHPHMHILHHRTRRYAGGAADRHYHCLECDTVWVCHTDQWGSNCGFKLAAGGGEKPE